MPRWETAIGLCLLLGGCTPELAAHARPDPAWPDAAAPMPATEEARLDAAVIVSIESEALGGRPGAREVGDAWYRALREGMGIKRRRIKLLRDEKATPWRVRAAVRRARRRVARGGVIWFVYLGPGSTPTADAPGMLQLAPGRVGKPLSQLEVLAEYSTGNHAGALAVFDSCRRDGGGGLPAPRLQWAGSVLEAVSEMGQDEPAATSILQPSRAKDDGLPGAGPSGPPTTSVAGGLAVIGEQLLRETVAADARGWMEPTNVAAVSAGTGERCTDSLAGHPYPALGYAALGALRGWADDAPTVTVEELAAFTSALARLHAPRDRPPPTPQAGGVDLMLRKGANEPGPDLAALAPPGTDPEAPPPPAWAEAPAVFSNFEDLAHIPAGEFTMGCASGDRGCEDDEKPAHSVTVDSLAMARHETTWAEYRECVLAGACTPIEMSKCYVWKPGTGFSLGQNLDPSNIAPELPVVCLTWEQAQAVCDFRGRRLPTEAEWERAARGPEQTKFPWGTSAPTCEQANFDACGSKIRPTGSTRPNAHGLYDMLGNVAEWTADWYGKRSYQTGQPGRDGVKVIRGGSYYAGPDDLRTSYRYGLSPEFGYSTVGARCAR